MIRCERWRGRVRSARSRRDVRRRPDRVSPRARRRPAAARRACDAARRPRLARSGSRRARVRSRNVASWASAGRSRHHYRGPTAMDLAAEASQRRTGMTQYFVGFVGDNTAEHQASAGCDDSLEMRRQLDQRVAQDVGRNQVEVAMNRKERYRREADRFLDAVEARVDAGILERRRIYIDGDYFAIALA